MSKEISDNTESSMTPLKRREFLLMAAGASLYLALPSIAFAEGAKWVSLGKADLFVKDQPRQVVLPDNAMPAANFMPVLFCVMKPVVLPERATPAGNRKFPLLSSVA